MADNIHDLADAASDIVSRHRCRPPLAGRPKIGATYTCSCGITYYMAETRVLGRAWLPR